MSSYGPRDGHTPAGSEVDDAALTLLATIFNIVVVLAAAFCLLVWLAGQLSGVLNGHGWPDTSPVQAFKITFRVAEDPGDPVRAWPPAAAPAVGPSWLIYFILLLFMAVESYAAYRVIRFMLNWRRHREFRRLRLGFAHGNEIRQMLSAKTVVDKAKSVRPSFKDKKSIDPLDVGYYIGRDIRSRQKLYGSAEDVFIILAPPRQGKDVHFCAPFTIDAPGPCIVTSTRADAFTNAYAMRAKMGKVYVFDPNGLTNWPDQLRWSPVNGAEDPIVAMKRANAFIAGAGFKMIGELAYWVSVSATVLRLYLHAAAVGRKTLDDVLRWSTQSDSMEPVMLLREGEARGIAAPGWADEMESYVKVDEDTRGRMWAVLIQALKCFADPGVRRACAPGPFEKFDLRDFLAGRNTLFILGKEEKGGGVAPLVTAMMEDLFDGTRKIAAQMPSSRLDPPLTIELNEAAHIVPLPNLPAYMGDSGGFSIALHVYLQSLSQARAGWGDHEAMIMWDNAAIRIIMGGAGNVDDLEDISRLMGKVRGKEVLSPDEVRTLKFGTAVVVARAARPVEVQLTPWWKRKDGDEIAKGKAETERLVLEYGRAAREEMIRKFQRAGLARNQAGPGSVTPLRRQADGLPGLPPAGGQPGPLPGDGGSQFPYTV